jgi:hypothetical protein
MNPLARQLRAEAGLLRAEAERRATTLEALADSADRDDAIGADHMVDGATFRIAVTTWRRACRAQQIEGARKIGKKYVAPRASVAKWLESRPTPKAPPMPETAPTDELDELLAVACSRRP